MDTKKRNVEFVGTARNDLRSFSKPVQKAMGDALQFAQFGGTPRRAKPLRGFGGAGVRELIDDHDGDTYRAVYTVRLRHAIYVRHCFQKKSTHGIATAKRDLDLIRAHLHEAEVMDRERGTTHERRIRQRSSSNLCPHTYDHDPGREA